MIVTMQKANKDTSYEMCPCSYYRKRKIILVFFVV